MAIWDFLKGELLEIIEWTDDSRDTLSYRFPDEDKAIKNGAQLIVRESQVVQFVYLGEFGDTFGPGKHSLTTDNIPILTRLKSWKFGLESPFKADRKHIHHLIVDACKGNHFLASLIIVVIQVLVMILFQTILIDNDLLMLLITLATIIIYIVLVYIFTRIVKKQF